jgi:PilZ domain
LATLYRSYESIPVRAAVRFPLRLEIVLRTAEREYPGVTEDVSANGLLFAAEELPAVGSEIRFELTMPATIMGGANDVLLHCVGRIVRHQRIADKLMAAAVIDEYSFRG